MDLTTLSDSQLTRKLVENAIKRKKDNLEKDQLIEEFFRRNLEGGSAKVGKIKGLIYKTSGGIARIYDNKFLDTYFGEEANKYKKDKIIKENYAIKLINE